MVQSHFHYCILSWCFSYETLIHKLQTTTNEIIRLVFDSKYEKDFTKVLNQCNILTIEQTAQLEISKFTHQYFHNKLPGEFTDFFQQNLRNRNVCRSRSKASLFLQIYRLKLTQQSLKYKNPVQWNRIPAVLREIKSMISFVKQVKQFLIAL